MVSRQEAREHKPRSLWSFLLCAVAAWVEALPHPTSWASTALDLRLLAMEVDAGEKPPPTLYADRKDETIDSRPPPDLMSAPEAQRAQQALEMLGLADGQPGSLFRRHTQGVEEQLAMEVLRLRKVYTLYASSVLAAILVVQRTLIAARDGLTPRITELEQRLTDATLKIRELEDGTRAAAYDAVVDASEELLLLLGARDGGIEDGTPIDAAAHTLRNALDHGVYASDAQHSVRVQDGTPEGRELRVTFEREVTRKPECRWLAAVESMPGVMAYGATRADAARAVAELAQKVVHDQLGIADARDGVFVDSSMEASVARAKGPPTGDAAVTAYMLRKPHHDAAMR